MLNSAKMTAGSISGSIKRQIWEIELNLTGFNPIFDKKSSLNATSALQ